MSREPILFAAAPAAGLAFVQRWRGQRPRYCCVLAHTDTCMIPGLSAAGISLEARPLTPAADAEVVLLGSPRCLPALPSNPTGAPGPSGITRAALQLANIDVCFAATGLHTWPDAPCRRIPGTAGASITHGQAVPHARALFDAGNGLGRELAGATRHVILGESVPGGTTTALSVLLALGYRAEGRVSGSQLGNAHVLKTQVAHQALLAAGLEPGDASRDPLIAVERVGDPMQPIVAGAAIAAAAAGCDVLLAGGSQMLAVAALIAASAGGAALERIAIGTTRWVVADPHADVPGLANEICSDLAVLAANLDFSASSHVPLRVYEDFLVKEGVGAGGACIAALLAMGVSIETLEAAIATTYDQMSATTDS